MKAVICIAFVAQFIISSAAISSSWPMFRGDNHNTGFSQLDIKKMTSHSEGRRPWKFQTDGLIWSTPVVDNKGVTYVGSCDRGFYAITPEGKLKWKYLLKEEADAIVDSAAAVDNKGTVYVPGGDDYIHALDAKTGKKKWLFKAHHGDETGRELVNSLEGNITFTPEGWVVAPSDNGYVYAVTTEGKEVWNYKTHGQGFLWSIPGFAPNYEWAVFGSTDKILYLIDPKTGKEFDVMKLGGEIKASPAVDKDGRIFLGVSDGLFMSFDVVKTDKGFELKKRFEFSVDGQIYASAAVFKDRVVFTAHDGYIYCLSRDGELIWKYSTGAIISASPIVTKDGVVIASAGNGKVYALELETGRRIWSYFVADRYYKVNLDASPALSGDGRIVVASFDGGVYSVPFEYCLKNKDPRCDLRPEDDVPQFAEAPAKVPGTELRYIHPSGQHTKDMGRLIEHNEVLTYKIVEFKKDGTHDPSVVLSLIGLDIKIEPKIDFTYEVSSDSRYLNIIPKTFWGSEKSYKITVNGQYYHRSNLLLDYLKVLFLPDFSYETEFKTTPTIKNAGSALVEGTIWNMKSLYVAQPAVMDSLIAAAVDGQRYLLTLIAADESKDNFLLLANHAKEEDIGATIIPDVEKAVLWRGQRSGRAIRFSGTFPFMAMGCGAMIDDFVLGAQIERNGDFSNGQFIGATSCLETKSNREDYAPSLNIIDEMCDYKFDFHMFGRYRAEKRTKARKDALALKSLKKENAEIKVTLTGREGKTKRVITMISLKPDSLKICDYQKKLIDQKAEQEVVFKHSKALVGCKQFLTIDESIIYADFIK